MCRTRMGKHRKWWDIMVLEVQDGGEGLRHLCSRDIQWMPICVKNDSMSDLCAAISLGRLDAFVRGESLCKDVAILIFKQPLHVDKNGEACHGVDDTSNELRSQFAPNLSDECKAYIERLLLMDYQLYSCLIFDEQQSRVPVAWAVTSRNKIEDIQVWLMELWRRGKEKRPDWRINAFITDDVSAEIQAIE
ncbi:hypothetical protein SUGI_0692150 [Cryptomeria japonica]|nr:hypothetical protein SUGI_0692150 [Cryptomeria japonica]